MLVLKKISGPKKIILTAVLTVIFLAIGYLFYGSFSAAKWAAVIGPLPVNVLNIPEIKTEFNLDFAKKYPYDKLRQPPNLPVAPGNLGRSNPFIPVSFFPGLTP